MGRSIISTLLIGVVAVGAFALRQGYHQIADLEEIFAQNWIPFAGIFAALVLWNYWFRNGKNSG